MPDTDDLIWLRLRWQRPLDPEPVASCLRVWATDPRSPQVVLELRLTRQGVTYLFGRSRGADYASAPLVALPNVSLQPADERLAAQTTVHLSANTRHRPLQIDKPDRLVRTLLANSLRLRADELLVVQIVLGPRRIPLAVPDHSPSSLVAPWYKIAWIGDGGQLDGEKRGRLREKVSDFGFATTIRLGVTAPTSQRRKALLLSLFASVRTAETPGVQLNLKHESAINLNAASVPWRWPLRLGVGELVGLTGWPLGDDDLPGLPSPHPKPLPAAPGTTGNTLVVAEGFTATGPTQLSLPLSSAARHAHILAPTGAGKSTLLAGWITQVIATGNGAIVVEPKGDLCEAILQRISSADRDRIVVLNPNDPAPVGLNPIATGPNRRPELVADALVAVFKQLYGKAVGARSQDILYAGVLTLARHPNSSLVMLPLLFSNPGLRRSLTTNLRDPLVLEPFWATFEQWSDAERAAAVAPIMNKLRPLLRPGLRGILGQREPRFSIEQVFTERKVLLVPLQRGIIGSEAAQLLASLIISEAWQAVQARAALPEAARHPVAIVIDEVQDYLHIPTDLADGLAQARGYGVGFVLAHQYLGQLPREMRAAILANALSRIVFRLPHEDAIVLEKGRPELTAADFESLGQYEVYASLFARGVVNPYASGKTLPLGPETGDADTIRQLSRERYGQPLDQVEAGFAALYDQGGMDDLGPTGRRRRSL